MRFFAAVSIVSKTLLWDDTGTLFERLWSARTAIYNDGLVLTEHPFKIGDRITIRGKPSNTTYFPNTVTEVLEVYYQAYAYCSQFKRNADGGLPAVDGYYPDWPANTQYLWNGQYEKRSVNFDLMNVDVTSTLKFGTQLHGGFSTASFQITGQANAMSDMLNKLLNAYVSITDGYGRTVWEGYISGTGISTPGVLDITCSGYYAKANNLYFDILYDAKEATTNLMTYPSFEGGKGAWGNPFVIPNMPVLDSVVLSNGLWDIEVVQVSSYAYRIGQPWGSYNGAAMPYDYTVRYPFNHPNSDILPNTTYVWSFYAHAIGLNKAPYVQVYHGTTSASGQLLNQQLGGLDTNWRRYEIQFTTGSGGTAPSLLWLVINLPNSSSPKPTGGTDYSGYIEIDAVQLEALGYATTYCDGTEPDCSWVSGVNGKSTRSLIPVTASEVLADTIEMVDEWQKTGIDLQANAYNVGDVSFMDKKVKDTIEWVCNFGMNDADVNQEAIAVYFALWKDRIPYLVKEPPQDHPLTGESQSSGFATGGSTTTLQDTGKSWVVNQWAGRKLRIIHGTGSPIEIAVVSNTSNTLTYASQSFTPNATSEYVIAPASGNAFGSYPVWMVTTQNMPNKLGMTMDIGSMFNKIYAIYNNVGQGPSPTQPAEDLLSQERYGVREGKVQNNEWPCKTNIDCVVRDIALTKYRFPRLVMSLDVTGMVDFSGGFTDYPYRIRAGHLILLKDVDSLASTVMLSGGQTAYKVGFVLKTDYDAASNVVRLDIGASDVSYEVLMSRLGMSGGLQ